MGTPGWPRPGSGIGPRDMLSTKVDLGFRAERIVFRTEPPLFVKVVLLNICYSL